ncbi:MFS transporter [Peterkaempfera bronchialis]|uniref:MFS transporter n=1 Tax=Peterkaempfera bronchialis TaxID=2126346 RepID=A0A345T1H1_9ACTN|nr:MFS transporter [Peterkaempfera bronchialis]AXI79826.1 MFS transporter [Peterkaempfera bronchialis]
MLSTYRQIFAAPGSLAFSTTGLLSRLPISMTGIGIVTMLSQLRGAYGLAGAVTATLALAAAVLGPQVSRLVDRYGQRRVALPATVLTMVSATALLLCARLEAPDWTLFLGAAGMGAMPSVGSMVRARWAHLYRSDPALLHTAYSFEAVMDEICFIVGPILAIGLATSVFPEAGVLLAGVFLTVGVALFSAQRRTEPPVHPREQHSPGSAIRSKALQVLVLTFVATGAIFGAVEVVTVAFAQEQGHTALSSAVLAVYALGSCLAGAVFGVFKPKGPMSRRFLLGVSLMAVSMLPLLLVGNLVALAVALFVAGLSISPTMVTTMGMVERLVPATKLNEGMTWTTTGLAVGVAVGSSVGGWTVDRAGASTGYWVPVVAGSLAAVTAFLGARRLRSAPEQEAERVEGDERQPQHHP